MATSSRLSVRRPAVAVTPNVAPGRASAVGGPLLRADTALTRMTAEQVITQIERYEAASASNAYALGQCLRELSQPKRYRDELGFETFEELLVARGLPSRVTAFKLISVVSTFSEREVTQLGGSEKSYSLIRLAKKQSADARRFLSPNARVLGQAVSAISARDINRSLRGEEVGGATNAANAAAKKASARLGAALRRAGVEHRMRVHAHGKQCVSVHLDAESASALVGMLARLRKLEKQAGASG